MIAVGALETRTWWPHLAKLRLDVLMVVFSGNDCFPRVCHTKRERERERETEGEGEGGVVVRDSTELTAGVNFPFSSRPNDTWPAIFDIWPWLG